MKRLMMIIGGILCVSILSSGMVRKEKRSGVTITPEPLRLFVDQQTDPYTIKVAYTLNIPVGYIPRCGRLIYQPYFWAAGHRQDLTPLIIDGHRNRREERRLEASMRELPDFPNAMRLESSGEGMKIRLSEIVPFQVWMAQGKLEADVVVETCDRRRDSSMLTLADGVIWFPQGPGPALVKYVKETAEVQKRKDAWFLYPTSSVVFDPTYDGNGGRMQIMMRWMDTLRNNPDFRLERITITGYASPDGANAYNQRLAEERVLQMKKRFVERRDIEAGLIQTRGIAEDWEGLKECIRKAEHFTDTEAVLRVLNGDYTDSQRKELLRRLPQYEYIRQHIFPQLQKVVCCFYYTQREEVTKVEPL